MKRNDASSDMLEIFNIGKKYKNRSVLKNVSLHVKKEYILPCPTLHELHNLKEVKKIL